MSFLDAREHGSKVGSGGHASAQNEVRALWPRAMRNRRLVSCSSPGVCRVSNGTCASRRAGPVQAIDRRERLRRLALETIDLSKDPYFMRNHLGQYECRLCLTLHNNEGNYLAHTQARRPVFADRPFCLVAAQHCRASAWRTPRRAGLFSPTAFLACWLRSTAGHQPGAHPGAPACFRRPHFLPAGCAALQGISGVRACVPDTRPARWQRSSAGL